MANCCECSENPQCAFVAGGEGTHLILRGCEITDSDRGCAALITGTVKAFGCLWEQCRWAMSVMGESSSMHAEVGTVHGAAHAGAWVQEGGELDVLNCTLTLCGSAAVRADTNGTATVTDSTTRNSPTGFSADHGGHIWVTNTAVEDCTVTPCTCIEHGKIEMEGLSVINSVSRDTSVLDGTIENSRLPDDLWTWD